MRPKNDILENCLERLAHGDTLEACLADYPQQADELRPLLQAAQQIHFLPSQQPNVAADRRIEQRLRRAVRQRDQVMIAPRRRPFAMENVMKSVTRLVPRVALGVVALGLIIFLIAQMPFWRAPEAEPVVSSTAIAVVGSESADNSGLDLSADPGEVPLYRITAQPVPDTPEAMLAWATEFGLTDPAIYERPYRDDPAIYVIGSDDRRLVFPSNLDSTGEIIYIDPKVSHMGDTLTFAEASESAVSFLREHKLLPATYQVDEPLLGMISNNIMQSVIVRATVPEGVIGVMNSFEGAMELVITDQGQVAFASLRQLMVESADNVPIISAQEAYEKALAGQTVGVATYSNVPPADGRTSTYTPSHNWQVGQEMTVTGQLNLFVNVEDGIFKASLLHADTFEFQLTGPRMAELAEENWPGAYRIQGVLTAQLSDREWELEVQDWQQIAYEDMNCLIGELVRQDNSVLFRSDEGEEYDLREAPEEIASGERLQVCLNLPAEQGMDLDWTSIQVPPPSEQVFSGGIVQEVAVTRVVVAETGEAEEETAVRQPIPPIPLPPGSEAANEAPVTFPDSPHELGDSVEMIGYIQGTRIVDDDAGSSRLELLLVNDADQSEIDYPFTYPLVAPAELMEEMAAFADLHIRVVGEIVSAPESAMSITSQSQAIAVESFDRPWPEEKLENFLGRFTVEEIEGQRRRIFTDHATEQRYVVDPQYTVVVREDDVMMNEAQILLTAVVHPFAQPIGGLPVLLNRGQSAGPAITAATDISQVPLPPTDRIGIINEVFRRGNQIGENDVIERVELVYPYDSYSNQSVMGAQPVEPVWIFYGRTAGTFSFTMTVRAVK